MDLTLDSILDIKIYQSKKGYRFSVDSLLLYNFINLKIVHSVADLGAGSGIIGILLAKKYRRSKVLLIELQERLSKLAKKNVVINNLEERVEVLHSDIKLISSSVKKHSDFDLVVSNPPFRKPLSGRINVEEERAIARHEMTISLEEIVNAASYLLKEKGRFCLIYHPARLAELIIVLKQKYLEPKRICFVHSKINTESKMVMIEAVKGGRTGLKIEQPFFIYNVDGSYTEEMKRIYGQI